MDNIKKIDITERIKTFDDACKELGNNHPLVHSYRAYFNNKKIDNNLIAYAQLRIIAAALNEGWEPTYEKEERRWFPLFLHTGFGLVFANANYASSYSNTYVGSRLAFKNKKLAEYAGTQFINIYEKFIMS